MKVQLTIVWQDAGIRVNIKARSGITEILQDKNSLLTLTGRMWDSSKNN